MTFGTGPDFTPGERVRANSDGETGTVATVEPDRIVVRWDDNASGAYSLSMACACLTRIVTAAEYAARHPEES